MIRLFISEWDERCNWLQTTAEHDVVWSIWVGNHGELSCAHWNRGWQFHVKSNKLIGASLACPSDWAQGPPLLCDKCGLALHGCRTIVYPSCGFFSRLSMLPIFNHYQEIHSASFVHHTILTDRDFKSESHLPMKFSWFCLIFTDIYVLTVSQGKVGVWNR